MKIIEQRHLNTVLRNAKRTRPENSMDDVLCLCPNSDKQCPYQWVVLSYSKKHDAFNAYDCCEDANSALEVSFWAELPTFEQ